MNPKAILILLRDAFYSWLDDRAPALGAALAYYTVFALAPLLIIIIAIGGLAFGQEAAQGQILSQIEDLLGENGAKAVQGMLESARQPAAGMLATIVGIVMLVLGSTGVFAQLQDSLNTVWKVAPKPGRGIRGILRDRLLTFMMVIGVGFLLLVSLVLSAALAALGKFFNYLLPVPEAVLHGINFVVSFGVITLLFAMIYKILPDAKISWSDVWIGAAVTSLLFSLGKFLIGLYLGKSGVGSAYGAAGSLVVILVWVYYTAQILLYGAEFTAVYAIKYGSRIVPTENAMFLKQQLCAVPGDQDSIPEEMSTKTAAPSAEEKPSRLKKSPLHEILPCMNGLILGLLILLLSGVSAAGQEIPPPSGPFEEILQQLKFDQPTRIVGRFRSLDGYEDAIWVDWTHRHDGTRWLPVRNEMMFKLRPRDARMMEFFRALKPGISVHMTVQQDQDGNRHILELEGA